MIEESPFIHIVDDDSAIRESLLVLLAAEGFQTRAYSSAHDFLSQADSATGCLATDVRMPGMTGIELLEHMKQQGLSLPVIVFTAYADISLAVRAMKAGAVDFIEKPFDDDALLAAIRAALARGNDERSRDRELQTARDRLSKLTSRENEVLAGLLKGSLNKAIAHELGVSVRTVEAHRANLMMKVQAQSLSELVRISLLANSAPGQDHIVPTEPKPDSNLESSRPSGGAAPPDKY
jgi:two-component system response regulator FixJ